MTLEISEHCRATFRGSVDRLASSVAVAVAVAVVGVVVAVGRGVADGTGSRAPW